MEHDETQVRQLFAWLSATDVDREMFKEGMTLITAIKHKLGDPDKLAYSEFYLPIVLNDGRIPEGMDAVQLCADLRISYAKVRQHLTDLLEDFQAGVRNVIGSEEAGHILDRSDRSVRRLIASGELSATKEKGQWRIERINALRLMAKKLDLRD